MADVKPPTPVNNILQNIYRLDFAKNVFQGIPLDFWTNKLSWDPSKWVEEAIAIRAEYEAMMEKTGWPLKLSNKPLMSILNAPLSVENNPLEILIRAVLKPDPPAPAQPDPLATIKAAAAKILSQ